MKNILTKLVIPFVAVGALIGGVATAAKMGWLSDEVAFWLWPTLFAVIFLALAVVALLRGWKLALWPLGAGFVVQTGGLLLLLLTGVFGDDRWRPLWYSLGAVGLVLLVMLTFWGVSTIRARILEKKMAEGGGGSQEDLARIRADMLEALDLLRRAGRGRNAIYDLPWFLVMGRPAAGKTVAIKNSDLGLPVKRDWVKGVGGTYTADWFFTNELIFLDTPGKWVTEGATDEGREHWRELIRLLRKYRGRLPLDGLVVVVPADDLLKLSDDELEEQAANVREVVDLIHDELQFRFPVYLLVSKCDLVEGFVDFFKGLPAQRRHEILGWSNEDPNSRDIGARIEQGFRKVHRRLENYRLEMLGRVAKRTQARRLFFFTEEFRGLERPLGNFADAFFQGDRYSEPPVFRGFYFTSGTQEGAPFSKAMNELAQTLGVPASQAQETGEEEQKRSYFLRDLFRDLMVSDEGLVGRTAGHWWKRRRNTIVGVFAPAGLALIFLILTLVALGLNKSTYGNLKNQSPGIVEGLTELRGTSDMRRPDNVERALADTNKLRNYHAEMTGFQPFRTFGMRRPQELDDHTFALFDDQFSNVVLEPTLAEAARIASDPEESCVDRIDVLRSVVWLRTGRRAGFEHLAGLDSVWGLDDDLGLEQAERLRRELRRQYAYLASNTPPDEATDLLPGFSVREVARSIRDVCGQQGATSTLELYRRWQEVCRDAPTPGDITRCYTDLNKALRNAQLDYEAFRRRFDLLKKDLDNLRTTVPEAKIGLEMLADLDLAQEQTEQCLTSFDRTIVPRVKQYADKQELIDQCRDEVDKASGRGAKYRRREDVLKEQETAFEAEEKDLGLKLMDYNTVCEGTVPGFVGVELRTLKEIVTSYRRVACFRQEGQVVATTRRPAPPRTSTTPRPTTPSGGATQRPTTRPPATQAKKTGGSQYEWFQSPDRVSSSYKPKSWAHKHEEWGARLESIAGAGYTETQTDYETGEVRKEIEGYASSYARAWLKYLNSLELEDPTPPIASWLDDLSKTKEFGQMVGPAREAAAIAEQATEPPFDAVAKRLRPLEGLAALEVGEYQALLGEIAADLRRCEQNPDAWQAYRQQLRARSKDNNIIKARDWVSRSAGPTLAEGSLTAVFTRPLDEAQAYVDSDNLIRRQWTDLVRLYDTGIREHAPFSGDLADDPVTLKNLRALLGGQTGAVARVRKAATGQAISAQADAWLTAAEGLSRLFFEEESDAPRSIKVNVTIEEEVYAPEEFGKNYRLEEVKVYLSPVETFHWKVDEERTRPMKLALFGDEQSEYAYVEGSVAERKGRLKRMIGKKWKPGEAIDAARAEGVLAPLKLFSLGQAGGEASGLMYSLEVPWKKDRPGAVQIPVRLSGKESAPLQKLLEVGLAPPPADISGG
jgi:hypothetical protein